MRNRHMMATGAMVLLIAGCSGKPKQTHTDYGDAYLAVAPPQVAVDRGFEPPLATSEPRLGGIQGATWPDLMSGVDFNSESVAAATEAARLDGFASSLAEGLTLDQLLAAVLARNPEIAAAREQVHAIETEHGQLDALRRVREQYRAFVEELDPVVGPRLPDGSGAASFPLPGAEGLRSRLIDQAVSIAREALHGVLRRLVRDARSTFAVAVYLQRRQQILKDQLQLAVTVKNVTQARFEAGSADLGSVLAVEERVARLQNVLDDTARDLQSSRADLCRLMSLQSPEIGKLKPSDLDAPDVEVEQRMGGVPRNPAARMVELKAERVGTMKELVETMSRPDADLDLSELPSPLRDDSQFRNQPAPMPPGPWYGLMEAYRAELGRRESALRESRAATLDQLRADALTASESLDTARSEKLLQETTLDSLADQAISTTMEAFRTGKVDIDRVLAALDQKLNAALGGAAARRDIERTAAMLDALLGPVAG